MLFKIENSIGAMVILAIRHICVWLFQEWNGKEEWKANSRAICSKFNFNRDFWDFFLDLFEEILNDKLWAIRFQNE